MRTSPSHARPPVVMGEPSLVPFTPRLLQLLQRRRPPPLSPSAAVGLVDPPLRLSLPSALLFIDVSGFTSLTESMSQKGASGLEQLTVTLNGFFALILHCIGGHRGDLLKVAGDALIVAFYDEDAADAAATRLFSPSHTASCSSSPSASSADASSTDGGLPLLTLRALRAALSLQSTVVCDGSLPLRLHIGATCGLTHYIVVGGEEQLWAVGGLTADIEAADTEATPIPPSSLPPPLPDLGLSAPATTEPLSPSTCSTASSVFSTFSPPSIPTSVAPHPIEPPSPTSPPRLTTADSPDQSLLSRARPRPLVLPRPPSDPSLFVVHRAGGSRWEFLAVGPAFDDLTTTVSDSKTGEVVCSGQLWARVSEVADVKGSQLDNGTGNWKVSACEPRHGAPLGKPEDEEAAAEGGVGPRSQPVVVSSHLQSPLVSFAMPALLSRLHTGLSSQSLWLGEYRRVTVLFISLPNPLHCQPPPPSTQSPPDSLPTDVQAAFHESKESGTASSQSSDRASPALPVLSPTASDSSSSSLASSSSSSAASSSIAVPSWLESFHQVVRTMQRAVFTLGGQVRQLLVDDKGCALIVAFGLPPLAQEDDAARALMAALDLLSAVHAQHPQVADSVSIGATTGRAWCGAVGSDRRKEYALVGDIVNLSARIMGNAVTRRRVMCDEETMRACGGRVRFSSNSRQVLVKGRVGLVMLYEPLGKARLSSSQPATAPQSRTDSPKTAQSSPVSSLFDRSIRRSLSSKSTSSAIVAHSPSTPGADWSRAFASPPLDESRALHSRDVALSRIASILVQSVGSVNGDDAAAEVDAQPADSSAAVAPVVVLEGGAGQGKTYLTARVAEQCRAAGMVVLIGTADSIEANSPFFAIALVLQDVVRLELTRLQRLQEEADEAKEVFSAPAVSAHSALLSLLPEADRRYVSLLYPLLPDCDEAERAPLLAVEVSMRPVLTRRLMRSLLLSHCQRHPSTVVLIEDAHWVDLQGWTLLRELTELIPTFRLMVTCRPIPAPDVISPASLSSPSASLWTMYAAVTEHPRCHHLVLAGLDLRTTTDLAIAFLGCRVLHPALASTIHQRSDGVPLFIQHLCSYLSEAHLVTVSSSGIARLDELQLANVTLPSSLEGLLASALDRLHPDCQLTLKVASVVGRHFSLSLVAACHPLAVDHAWLQSMMALAEQQRIVEKQTKAEADRGQLQSQRPYTGGEEGEEEEEESDEELRDAHYRFTHQLVRDAAYSSLLYQQRRDLHAQVADHLRLLSEADSGQDAHLSSPFSKPQTSTSGVRSASAQLLSHHYWLSVCVSGNVVAEKPDQRLLQCAVEYLLQTASGSRQLGAMDAVGLLLCLAARGLRRLQDEDRRDVLQVRWLYLVLGSEILYNLPLVQMLAIELGDASSAEGAGTHAVGSRCLRAFAHRMLSALAAKAVLKNLDPMQLQGTPLRCSNSAHHTRSPCAVTQRPCCHVPVCALLCHRPSLHRAVQRVVRLSVSGQLCGVASLRGAARAGVDCHRA